MTTALSIVSMLTLLDTLEAEVMHGSMPDEAMDDLIDRSIRCQHAILNAPCLTESDVLAKMGLAARMVADEGGVCSLEVPLLRRIADDLESMRERERANLQSEVAALLAA